MEIINGILAEMRAIDYGVVENDFVKFADRIEEAVKNLSTENKRLKGEIKCMMQKYAVKLSTAVCHQACSCDLLNGLKTENKRLRDLVGELTNALETINTKIDFDPSIGFKWTIGDEEFESLRTRALVDKAREEVKKCCLDKKEEVK